MYVYLCLQYVVLLAAREIVEEKKYPPSRQQRGKVTGEKETEEKGQREGRDRGERREER